MLDNTRRSEDLAQAEEHAAPAIGERTRMVTRDVVMDHRYGTTIAGLRDVDGDAGDRGRLTAERQREDQT